MIEQSKDNPVFYVQTRMPALSSVFRNVQEVSPSWRWTAPLCSGADLSAG